HAVLIPAPQKVDYGTGTLYVDGLQVKLAHPSEAVEDRFAAQTLRACLLTHAEQTADGRDDSRQHGKSVAITLNRTGAVAPLALPGETTGPKSLQAYVIKIGANGGEITASSSAGVFYGVQTVCQLVEGVGANAELPQVEIHDWPTFAFRGVMVDMSHGPLPNEAEIDRQLDFLSRWKANQYYLYNEASIELDGYSLVNPRGRLSKAEVRRIVAYGRERHIDIIPNLELYGHMHDLFRVERYADMADQVHGVEFDPSNEKAQKLLANWAAQYAALFPSPFVHIGFDEAFQIRPAAKRMGVTPEKLYVDQLTYVTKLFQSKGKTVMAYSDMMIKYPKVIPQLPHGLIAVPWRYYVEKDFTPWIGPLAKAGIPMMIQPGVTSWNQISPDYARTFANIDGFVAAGRNVKAMGVLVTVWADDGQLLMRMSYPGMAYGVASAWQDHSLKKETFFSDYARLMYPAQVAPDVAQALQALTESETNFQKVFGLNAISGLWYDPFSPVYYKHLASHREDFRQTRLLAEDAEESLMRALANGGDPATLNSLLVGARTLDYAGSRYLSALDIANIWQKIGATKPDAEKWWNEFGSQVTYQDHSLIVDLMDAITELRPQYKAEWLAEYTPYRLGSTLGRWDAEYQYWRALQDRLKEFSDTSHEGDNLPPLESVVHAK
ncbi:MAG: glycoside hydrolase family 20 zincin-like fold domain-containing protein, partial [Bryocella sp.]